MVNMGESYFFKNLEAAPLSVEETKAKHILTIKNPRFWLEGILQVVGIVISVVFLLPWLIENITSSVVEGSLGATLMLIIIIFVLSITIVSALYAISFWIKLFKSFNPIDVDQLKVVTDIAKEDTVIKRYVQKALAQRDYLYLAEYRAIRYWAYEASLKKAKKEQKVQREREQKKKKAFYAELKDGNI